MTVHLESRRRGARRTLLLVGLAALLGACGCRQDAPTSAGQAALYFAGTDEELKQLREVREQARGELDEFIEALDNPAPNQRDFAVKRKFSDQQNGEDQASIANVEYMWVAVKEYENGVFRGTLDNEPRVVGNKYRQGQQVEVPADQVEDWLYVDNGQLRGGRSIPVLREFAEKPTTDELETSESPAERTESAESE